MSSSSSKSSSHDAPSSSPFARNNNENNTSNRRRNSKSSSNATRKNRFVFAYKRAALRAKRDVERKSTNARNVLCETKVNFENAVMKPLLFFVPTIGRKSEEKEKTFVSKRSSKEEANWAQKDRWNALRERAIDPIKRAVSSASGNVSKGGQFFTKIAEEKEGKMKSGSYVSSPAKEEVPKKNKKDEDSAKRFNGFVFPLEKERKRVEERWKEVVEKMKKERMATFTSSSSSSADARKQDEQQKNKNKNADNGKEGRNSSSLMIKAKAEKMTKEVSLKLNENVSKVNAAIEARKKETEDAFTSAKRRVMAMTVKKDAERDDGKHKNKRRVNNKSSTSTNSSSNNNNNNNRDSENKKNKKKTATGEEPPPTNIFERSKSAASDFFGTATASMEDVKGNIDSVQKSVAKKLSDMQLRENFEGTTQNIARESKKLVTEDLPSTIKTLSKESANLTGSALKEFNENIDVDVIAQNAKKSFEGTSKTVETLIRDVHSNASLAAASGKALVTDLIDPPEKMHRVRQGESLLKIARKYDVSVVDVCRVNNLEPTDENPHFVAIKIGQVLNIPNPERMAEQPAYESSKFDEKYESTVNAYYEQRLNASSSSSKMSKVAVATSEGGGLGGGGAANIRIAESSSSSSGNAKLAGSFALLATAAAISYLRAGLDDDDNNDNNDSNTNNNTTIGGDENTNSQML